MHDTYFIEPVYIVVLLFWSNSIMRQIIYYKDIKRYN